MADTIVLGVQEVFSRPGPAERCCASPATTSLPGPTRRQVLEFVR